MRPRTVWLGVAAAAALSVLHLIGALWSPVVALPLALVFLLAARGLCRGAAWAGYGSALFLGAMVAGSLTGPFYARPASWSAALLAVPCLLLWLSGRALGPAGWRGAAPWLAGSVATFVFLLVLHPFLLPTGSMEDTLLAGDHLFVQQAGLGSPARGQLAVFRKPGDPAQFFIKRVVAVEGDRMSLRGTKLYVNGQEREEPYARYTGAARPDHEEVTVPAGHVFVLGDNRDNSLDSRHFGFVPVRDVVARPRLIYFSTSSIGDKPALLTPSSVRWNRTLKWL